MGTGQIDVFWVLLCTFLVFSMQAGFLFVEAGLARSKNYINIAVKNITDIGAAVLVYWLFGYGIMYGFTGDDPLGLRFWAEDWSVASFPDTVFFLFQAAFAGTTVTIISGAVAERMRYGAYLYLIAVMSLVYPVIGRWTWGGGWLAQRGFVDFAGSSVVHVTGGGAALAAVMVLGPRIGIFDRGDHQPPAPSSMPLALYGGLVLWLGWLGFNGGSTLAFNEQVASVIFITMLGAAAGVLVGLVSSVYFLRYISATAPLNGALGGLVAITAGTHAFSATSAVIIGGLGGILALTMERWLVKAKIDDVVSAVPVHFGCGAWGTIAAGMFGRQELLGTGLGRLAQIGEQLLGLTVIGGFAFGVAYAASLLFDMAFGVRVSVEDELLGLNEAEHRVTNEMSGELEGVRASMLGEISVHTQDLAIVMQKSLATTADQAADFLRESELVAEAFDKMLDQIGNSLKAVRSANGSSTESATVARRDGGELTEKVRGLAARSSEIESVVNIISDLANDSTMLALNARIEAERAGDAGAGFAAVAEEVKALARNTLTALDTIRGIVETTRTETDEVTESASLILDNLAQLAVLTSDNVSEATVLTEEQGAQTEQLSQAFGRMAGRAREMQALLDSGSKRAEAITSLASVDS